MTSIHTRYAPQALALCAALALPTTHAQTDSPMHNPFQLEQQTHAVLAQYHRWYQVYEVPFTEARIANQKDILSDDVEIVSQMGTSKGKSGLEDRLKVFTGWQNAHHVQNTAVTVSPDGKLLLEADIVYQNIRPDHSQYSYILHYSTRLQAREHDLPVFERLELRPTGEVKPFTFEAAYAENRAQSFMHYWLYLIETAHQDSGKFRELLAKDFSLQLSDGPAITQFAAFEQWLASIPARVRSSSHAARNFRVVEANDHTLQVSVDFDWKGITPDGKAMVAQTHHAWVLANNPDERFARLQSMQVTVLKPYQLVP